MAKIKNLFLEDYLFKGNQCLQANKLSNNIIDKDSNAMIFDSTVELYMTAALVGCYYNKREKPDKGDTRRIFAEQFNNRYKDLMFIYQLIMLSNKTAIDDKEKINNAFRYADKPENVELFNEFVLGGLGILYNHFYPNEKSESESSYEDYFDRLLSLMQEFKENSIKDEDIIDNFD